MWNSVDVQALPRGLKDKDNKKSGLLVVLDSPNSEEESGEPGEEEGGRAEPGGHREAPPLADLAEVVGSRDVLEETWNWRKAAEDWSKIIKFRLNRIWAHP